MNQTVSQNQQSDPEAASVKSAAHCPQLAVLYAQYCREFVCYARRYHVIGEEGAAGIWQEAFLAFYYNASTGRLKDLFCSLRTCVFEIALYKIRNGRRRESEISCTDISVVMKGHFSSAEGWAARQEVVYEAVAAVPEPCNGILDLCYSRRMPMDEIAALMGYADGRIARNRKTLCVKKLCENITAPGNLPVKITDERIDRYVNLELTPEEAEAFESEIATNAALAEELDAARHISEAFTRKAERKALEQLLSAGSEKQLRRVARISKRPPGRRTFAGRHSSLIVMVVVCLGVGLLLYGYMPRYNSMTLYKQAFTVPPFESYYTPSGGGEEDLEWLLEMARESYQAEDYTGAIGVLGRAHADYTQSDVVPELLFYMSVCCLALEDYQTAVWMFEDAKDPQSPYYRDAQWYYALTRLAADERLAARGLLEEIISEGEGPYVRQAATLVEKIKTKRWF